MLLHECTAALVPKLFELGQVLNTAKVCGMFLAQSLLSIVFHIYFLKLVANIQHCLSCYHNLLISVHSTLHQ